MGRQRIPALTLAQVQGTEGTVVAARQFARGLSWLEVYRVLRGRYPNAPQSVLQRATSLGREARAAGVIGEGLPAGERIPRASVPVNPTLPQGTAYRYAVVVYFIDPTTGQSAPRVVEVDSPRNLPIGELRDQAEQLARLIFGRTRARRGRSPPLDEARIEAIGIESVERRTR